MHLSLTDEQRAIHELARDFARREMAPVAAEFDRSESFPTEVFEHARSAGLLHVALPEEHGGPGLGVLESVLIAEQFAWACAGMASAFTINAFLVDALLLAGTDEQKAEYFRRIASGELGSFALTEPAAGSDVRAIETVARQDGSFYVLSGSKIWITNAPLARFFLVFAVTDPGAGVEGISAFLVERDARGLSVGQKFGKLGQRTVPTAAVFLDEVPVPAQNLLGAEGDGFLLAMRIFDRSRPVVASFGVGVLERCLDESLRYAADRETMGKPIIDHQAVGHKLAEMAIRLEAARLLTYKAAWLVDRGEASPQLAASAKAFAADNAMWAATEAVQIFGGMGYSTEYPVEKLFRDAKVIQIYEGTSEIQRNIIVRELRRGVHARLAFLGARDARLSQDDQ